MTQAGRGEVYDLGYRRYEGEVAGRPHRIAALVINGMRTALGIGRGLGAKVLPALLFLALMVPALVFMIIAIVGGPATDGLIGVSRYYQVAAIPLLLLSAALAPELLTTDRRSGLLTLYLVRPITSEDYVLGRWLAFFCLTLVIVWLPQALLFAGVVLGATDTWEYLRGNWLDVPRFLLAGVTLAVFTTTLPLAVAAFIDRRAIVAVAVIAIWFVAAAVGNALGSEVGGAGWLYLIDFGASPVDINDMIFGNGLERDGAPLDVPAGVVVAWYLLWVAVPAALLWRRYRDIGA